MHVLIENLVLCLLYDYNSFNNNCSLQKKKRYNFADGPAYCMSKKLMNEMKRSVRFIMLLIILCIIIFILQRKKIRCHF